MIFSILIVFSANCNDIFSSTPGWFLTLILSVVITILFYYYSENGEYNVAHIAHLGGAIQGVFVGCLSVRNLRVTKIENMLKVICFLLASGFIGSVWYRIVLVNNYYA